jgi:hypothetical protein
MINLLLKVGSNLSITSRPGNAFFSVGCRANSVVGAGKQMGKKRGPSCCVLLFAASEGTQRSFEVVLYGNGPWGGVDGAHKPLRVSFERHEEA